MVTCSSPLTSPAVHIDTPEVPAMIGRPAASSAMPATLSSPPTSMPSKNGLRVVLTVSTVQLAARRTIP